LRALTKLIIAIVDAPVSPACIGSILENSAAFHHSLTISVPFEQQLKTW
jgi:hypothetical protein